MKALKKEVFYFALSLLLTAAWIFSDNREGLLLFYEPQRLAQCVVFAASFLISVLSVLFFRNAWIHMAVLFLSALCTGIYDYRYLILVFPVSLLLAAYSVLKNAGQKEGAFPVAEKVFRGYLVLILLLNAAGLVWIFVQIKTLQIHSLNGHNRIQDFMLYEAGMCFAAGFFSWQASKQRNTTKTHHRKKRGRSPEPPDAAAYLSFHRVACISAFLNIGLLFVSTQSLRGVTFQWIVYWLLLSYYEDPVLSAVCRRLETGLGRFVSV